ncbi:MAG: transposase [candidate division WWE3 bacterium]|nr:transposase [candidate division WWE3 bacterium]
MLDKYDRVIRPKRKLLRLPGVDYSTEWYYFVTICVENRRCILGNIVDGNLRPQKSIVGAGHAQPATEKIFLPSRLGKIVENVWKNIPDHYPVSLNTFQIMPSHLHFIIEIAGAACHAPTLGSIVGSFKSEMTKQVRLLLKDKSIDLWQRSYFERIIRNEKELAILQYYIEQNPND